MNKKKKEEDYGLEDIYKTLNDFGVSVYKILEPMMPIIIDAATILQKQELELIEKDSDGNLIELE